jgi:DNA-binding response OmpR family regulator
MTTQKRLLIVEDSPTQARAIAAYLSDDVDVVIATDGFQALRVVAVEQPVLIILDVNLPKMDGIQVCRRLKRDPQTAHIPIVMLTSATSSEQREEGMMAGADQYILKGPDATQELLKIIRLYKVADYPI